MPRKDYCRRHVGAASMPEPTPPRMAGCYVGGGAPGQRGRVPDHLPARRPLALIFSFRPTTPVVVLGKFPRDKTKGAPVPVPLVIHASPHPPHPRRGIAQTQKPPGLGSETEAFCARDPVVSCGTHVPFNFSPDLARTEVIAQISIKWEISKHSTGLQLRAYYRRSSCSLQ